jgi:AcrR family transcriptional regulator
MASPTVGARRRRRPSPVLASPDEIPGALPPRQVRSVGATWQIAEAGQRLFLEREYEAVSVADIAAAAERSVGAFYTRFPTKEHLIVHLALGLTDELRAQAERALDPIALAGRGVAEVIEVYFALAANSFIRYRGIIRPASLIARQTRDEALRELVRRFNADVHARFRDALLQRLAWKEPAIARTQVNSMILWSSAALREVLLYGEPVSSLSHTQSAFLRELVRAAACSLECDRDG